MEDFEVGKDVVLKEREVMKELLSQLPLKAQLGFSALRDQMAQKGEHGLRKFLQSARPHDSIKLEYTCLDISEYFIALGCNLGLVFFYDRYRKNLNRFVCEVKHAPVSCTKILESQHFVASGQYNGNLTIFHYLTEKNGLTKPLLKCTVESHHIAPVTAIQWTPDGTKLFTGDSEGHVAITVINMDEGQTHTVFICNEESPVVQLAFSHTALLVSTLRRSLVWPFNTKMPVQVGQQERKVFGNFGACFFPTPKAVPSELQPVIYAARPGLRIWKGTMEGKVLVTMFFKESVSHGEPEIYTIGLPSKGTMGFQQEQRQFGTIEVLDDAYLVTFQGSFLWVIDPISGRLIGCHGNLGCVIDVGVFKNEVFVLTKGEEHFIRKITFRTRAESPIIQVKELTLDDEDVENEKNIRRSSSVNQFEESAKLERLIDDVGNTMVGIISGVKSTVVRTIGQITIKDDSEEERSDGGYGTSGSYSSPKSLLRSVNGQPPQPSEGNISNSSLCVKENNLGSSLLNGCTSSSPDSSGAAEDSTSHTDTPEKLEKIDVVIEHKSRESEAPFQHLVNMEYPEIVFEGTSKGIPVSRRRKKKRKNQTENNFSTEKETPIEGSNSSVCKIPVSPESTLLNTTELPQEDSPERQSENSVSAFVTFNGDTQIGLSDTSCDPDISREFDSNLPFALTNDVEGGQKENLNVTHDENEQEKKLSTSLSDSLASLSDDSSVASGEFEGNMEDMRITVQTRLSESRKTTSLEIDSVKDNTLVAMSKDSAPYSASDEKLILSGEPDIIASEELRIKEPIERVPKVNDQRDTNRFIIGAPDNSSAVGGSVLPILGDSNMCNTGNKRNKKSHKKVHSLSALIDFQLEIDRNDQRVEMTSLRERVQKNFHTSSLDSFKSRSSSMDALNVTNRVPLYLPTLGLAYKQEHRDSKGSLEGSRSSRRISGSSSISSAHWSEQGGNLEPDDNILNVEISTQDSYLEKSSSSERCKKIEGEAVERTYVPSTDSSVGTGHDDSILANLVRLEDEDERVQVKESPRVKAPHEPSPFPPPQISTLTSIYSQEAVSLSDVCFSEPGTPNDDLSEFENSRFSDQDVHSSALESIDSDELEDLDGRDTPPVNLDTYGGVEMTDLALVTKQLSQDGISDDYQQIGDSEPENDKDFAIELSSSASADRVSERLRLLADSWAEISLPSCGQVQFLTVSDSLAWCIDNHDHIFYSLSSSLSVSWKRLDGRARLISSNQAGSVVWAVCRKRCAYYRTNIKDGNPQGSDWEPVEKDVLCVAVDSTGVWGIKMNGDVFVRPGVSPSHPQGKGWRTVRVASDLVQISCVDGVVWALDIYNHVQVYQVEPENQNDDGHVVMWKELPGISASYVRLGPTGVCWIIDRDGGIWFNLEVSPEMPFGASWYQLSWSDSFVHDTSLLTSVISYFKQDHEPKALVASDNAGVWILSKYGKIRVSRGHLLGTRWELKAPTNVSSSSCWTCVSAQGCLFDREFIWALQPNGKLHCFNTDGLDFTVPSPPRTVLKYISSSKSAVWALTSGSDVYVRRGITASCPQGSKWTKVDMTSQGQEKLCHVCAGNLVVWAVDYQGNVWFQMGKEEHRQTKVAPAWLQVEGCPFDGCQLTKVMVGAGDLHVWAIDDRNNVYVRRDVTDNFLIGLSWEVVPGTGAKDLAISDNLVWALCPNGDVICRYGVSTKNCMGDYWKKAPGSFDHITVGLDNELWGIDRQGHLYQRQTIHFYGTESTKKTPSYSQLFPTDDDWELI